MTRMRTIATFAILLAVGCGGGEKKEDKPADSKAAPADGKTESAPPPAEKK